MNSLHIAFLLVKRVFGKKRRILSLLVLPSAVVALVLSMVQDYKADGIQVEIVNEDHGALGGILTDEWRNHPEIIVRTVGSRKEAEDRVLRQMAEAAVIIPAGYTEDLLAGRNPVVELNQLKFDDSVYLANLAVQDEVQQMSAAAARIGDGTDGSPERTVEAILRMYKEKQKKGAVPKIDRRDYLRGTRVTTYTGIFLMFIMGSAAATLSIINGDRRNMTLFRLYSYPVRHEELMAGHFLGCLLVGTVQILFVLVIARILPHADYGVTLVDQWLVLECFLLAAIGLFSAVAGIFHDRDRLNVIHALVMTPTSMLGGCFWPIDAMPESMRKLSNFVPQKWVIDAVAKLSSGAGLRDISYHLGILILTGLILLSFGTALFKPART